MQPDNELQSPQDSGFNGNTLALRLFAQAQPTLVDVQPAARVIPILKQDTILHAGPPITWEAMCPAMRGGVLGALIYEGLANNLAEAQRLAPSGMIRFAPAQNYGAIGSGCGILSASMPVWVIEDRANHTHAYAPIGDGLRRGLQHGANGSETLNRLNWLEGFLAPRLRELIRRSDGIELFPMLRSALQMGDEGHVRNKAAMQLLQLTLLPFMLNGKLANKDINEILAFLRGHNGVFLNLTLGACKAAWHKAESVSSTLITAIASNGVEMGIRLNGGWHTAPAPVIEACYLPEYSAESANPLLGDDNIAEASGLGGFAAGSAPAIHEAVGKTAEELLDATLQMYEITADNSPHFVLPILNNRGAPTGIDVAKVVNTGIAPFATAFVMHRQPGIGHIGSGVWRTPLELFARAFASLTPAILDASLPT